MSVPAGPDYTAQLNKLIQVLSQKESIPAWGIALLGAGVGFILALVAEPIKAWIGRLLQLKRLRKVVLAEVLRNIRILQNALDTYYRNNSQPQSHAYNFRNVV